MRTENAYKEQWKLLSQFSYPANIKRHFVESGFAPPSDRLVNFVSAAVSQGREYFFAAANSELTISPLLYYYGTSNLLNGLSVLVTGAKLPVEHHGMVPEIPQREDYRIAELKILPVQLNRGSLQLFANVFSPGVELVNSDSWSIGEILGSIPDLKLDFEQMYQDSSPYTLPVEIVNTRRGVVERIARKDMSRFKDPKNVVDNIIDLNKAYLEPQLNSEFLILHPRLNGVEIGEKSIFGQKHIQLAHLKNGRKLLPNQLILMYMGLFGLGHISRYQPEIWNRFVERDETGERLLIEKFLDVCYRYVPNLALNKIRSSSIQFVNTIVEPVDRRTSLSDDDIQKLDRLGR
ncbi:MAG: hypothetical protein KIT08_08515 [Anaerolineales bacterium]|nr:MAG: hypothetical protein KIT08_08515 [Anaerolineales bacterium]